MTEITKYDLLFIHIELQM